jgi:hypothetical protein
MAGPAAISRETVKVVILPGALLTYVLSGLPAVKPATLTVARRSVRRAMSARASSDLPALR